MYFETKKARKRHESWGKRDSFMRSRLSDQARGRGVACFGYSDPCIYAATLRATLSSNNSFFSLSTYDLIALLGTGRYREQNNGGAFLIFGLKF